MAGALAVPVLVQHWAVVALFVATLGLCILRSLRLSFCTYHQSRWITAAVFGTMLASLLAPSAWIGATVLGLAAAIPMSLLAFHRRWTIALADPIQGASTLGMVAVWTAGLGVTAAALRATGVRWLVLLLLGLAAYNVTLGIVQVSRGIDRIKCVDAAFAPIGSVLRQPTAWLCNVWKPACINALLAPIAFGLLLEGGPLVLPMLLLLTGMAWQMRKAGGVTSPIGAAVGILATLAASSHFLAVPLVFPLLLTGYPFARRKITGDPRWEAWQVAVRLIRRHRGLGLGLGGWMGLQVQTPKEGERIWMFLHNDWLETWLECGPLPVLCALGFLGSAVIRVWGGVSPLEAGLFGSLIALAVTALGYMPWRVWPVNLVAVGILACWTAL